MLIKVLPGSLPADETYIFPIRNNSERASFEPLQIRSWKSESAEGYFGEKTAFFSNKASRCGILTHLPFAPTRARVAACLAACISSRAPCRLTAYARACARARERYGGRTPPTPPPVPHAARPRRIVTCLPARPPRYPQAPHPAACPSARALPACWRRPPLTPAHSAASSPVFQCARPSAHAAHPAARPSACTRTPPPSLAPPPASRLCPSCEPCSSGKFVLETSISRSYNASLRLRVYGYTRARG